MSRRKERRKFLALPVRALCSNNGSRQVVCTLDLSVHGARVIGLPEITVGQEVALEHNNNRVRFQAVWVGQPGSPRQGQVGLYSLDPKKRLAAIEEFVAGEYVDQWSPREAKLDGIQPDRRAAHRFDTDRGVQYWIDHGSLTTGHLDNISLNGCGIGTKFPLPRHTRLNMIVSLYSMKIAAQGEVRVCSDEGMGVVFTALDRANDTRLKKAVHRLRQATPSAERILDARHERLEAERILEDVRDWFDRHLTMSWEDFFDIQVRLKGSLVKATETFDKFTS